MEPVCIPLFVVAVVLLAWFLFAVYVVDYGRGKDAN